MCGVEVLRVGAWSLLELLMPDVCCEVWRSFCFYHYALFIPLPFFFNLFCSLVFGRFIFF